MPQFVMCRKSECPKTHECYRYRAIPDGVDQPFSDFNILCNETDNYRLFIKIRPDDKIIEIKLDESNKIEINDELSDKKEE
jgi:hypothetical protein